MSSWSRRVKICGLKSSIEVQLPTLSGNLKKKAIFLLVYEFRELLVRFDGENRQKWHVVSCDHRSPFLSSSRITSCSPSETQRWPCRLICHCLLQATVTRARS